MRLFLVVFLVASGAFAQATSQIAEARALLREAGKLVPEIEEVQQSATASNIAGQQVLAGDLAGALETVHAVKAPQDTNAVPFSYYGIAWSLGKMRDWRTAMGIVRELPDGSSKATDYLAIAESLAARGDFEHALTAARAISSIPKAASQLADALLRVSMHQFKAGDPTSAAETLDQAREAIERKSGSEGSGVSAALWYAEAIDLLVEAGNSSAATPILARLYATTAEEEDPHRRAPMLERLAASQARVGDFTAAVRSARRLDDRERAIALLTIATEQAKQGDPAGARRLVAEIPVKSWPAPTIAKFAYALSKSGDSAGALEILKKIPAPEDRAFALADLALEQAMQPDSQAALTAILAMEEARRAGDAVNPFVFELVSVTRAVLGDFPGARQIVGNLNAEHSVWPIWNLTEQLVAAGRKSEALALARAQEFPRARACALLGIASAMLEQIEAERVRKK